MAVQWTPKAPGSEYRYTWLPDLVAGDSIASATLAVTSGDATIVSYSEDDTGVSALVSGGTVLTTIAATATTTGGETLNETIYLPIRASGNGFSYTARDVVEFAMRKIVGNGNQSEATEAADALERLNDMVAVWRINGLDVGLPVPLAIGDTLSLPDEYVMALKFNLRVACHDHYDAPITAYDAEVATETKRLIANRLLTLSDLASPAAFGWPEPYTVAGLF